ncbi:zinc finger CCHC domain-containing protein 7-like [Leuresthes tenuis]|uniref:zinc finger CCHC domain-containing protein 7-like n=1 Tax=Leuresthes tenuis TaxID=355514 RepID=UPI003B4FFC07
MNFTEENEVDDGQEETKDGLFFIEDYSSSESEEEINFDFLKHHKRSKQAAQLRESSPPLLLAFSITSAKAKQETNWASTDEEEEDGDSDQPIEEWMIIGGEEQVEDSSIQLNLNYWSSSDDDFGAEDWTDENMKSVTDSWAVSDKDKYGADPSLTSRYYEPRRCPICHICNRTGHAAKSCYLHKKGPTCVLCGIQGHIQKNCPGRPCSSCGLPSHGLSPCRAPPVWNQHCQRCWVTGHLSDGCPDIWRQYHLTVTPEVPLRPTTVCGLKHGARYAHCYNCSKRGHYGYECTRRRMVSGTFPSLPYVCQYDTMEDFLLRRTRTQTRAMEAASVGSLQPSAQKHSDRTGESGEEKPSVMGRNRTTQEGSSRADRRKTWPERRRERRRERRAVKQLRREAQAMREGGLPGRSRCNSDDELFPADPLRQPLHGHREMIPPPEKKRREETAGGKSRKSREAERWKKRGGMKRGDLYACGDMNIESENLLSPKQRVRHRRR